jgi:ADP-ribosyl-[dinitrogen reductase] hydrolase
VEKALAIALNSLRAGSIEDRAVGAFLGLAIGDALGTTLEFTARDAHPPLTDIVGGGPFDLEPGHWTDDTAMALALADSLLTVGDLDEADLMQRFVDWQENGAYSCTGTCFDIGRTTWEALQRWKITGEPVAGSTDPRRAGNGSLMRLAPVAIRFWRDRNKLANVAARQSLVTHGAPEAAGACVAFADILADAIEGKGRDDALRPREGLWAGKTGPILRGSWRTKQRDEIRSSGYVIHSLEAALWCVGNTNNFRCAVLTAANLGEDADTAAAIAGQLAGAVYGARGIPAEWKKRVAWSDKIIRTGKRLFHPA